MTPDFIKKEIDRLFSDTTVSVATTRDRLEDVAAHIEMLLETLPTDKD